MRFTLDGHDVVALDRVSLSLAPGSLTTVVGRSGCGKTTLLRLLAGLQTPSHGTIDFGPAPPRIGYVFQEPRLMPWLSVRDNIAFGLARDTGRAAREARVAEALEQVGLTAFAQALPDQLSGGMASRVGVARALVREPDLLLMDEPFAALDAFTRRGLQAALVRIWQQRRPTVVFVTHDVEEAVVLGQTVAELAQGRLVGQHPVPLPYPRDATDPALLAHRRAVLERLLTHAPGDCP
jgi:sulfonate transport system ATP-binding protein